MFSLEIRTETWDSRKLSNFLNLEAQEFSFPRDFREIWEKYDEKFIKKNFTQNLTTRNESNLKAETERKALRTFIWMLEDLLLEQATWYIILQLKCMVNVEWWIATVSWGKDEYEDFLSTQLFFKYFYWSIQDLYYLLLLPTRIKQFNKTQSILPLSTWTFNSPL